MQNRIYGLLLLCFLTNNFFAQEQRYIDSLVEASHSKVDSVRFKAYSFLAWNLKETNKTEALRYASLLLKEAGEAKNQKWIARSLSDHSVIYEYGGDLKKALDYAERALAAVKLTDNKKDLAGALFNLASIHSKNNELATALELQLQALKLYEALKKNYYIAACCNALGVSYNTIGDYKSSNTYLRRALEISRARGDVYIEAMTLGPMADNYRILKQTDSSKICYEQTKKILKEMGDNTNYATACNNLGELHFSDGDIKSSEKEYREALEISRSVQDTGSIATSEANLAKVFTKQGKYKEAEELLLNALKTAHKLGNGEAELIVVENLVSLYTHKRDAAQAELYFKRYSAMKDSIFSKETALRFSEAQTKFDVEKKDLEILKNKAELDRAKEEETKKNLVIVAVAALFLAILISTFYYYRKKRIQQQAEMDQEMALQKEMRAKAIIEAEEKERRRIAQDLHDGIGQILSAAKLNLSSFESTVSLTDEVQKEVLKNTLSLIDDSVKEVRSVSHNMMPNTLIKLGLASAIKEFIAKMGNLPNLKIDLEIVGLDQRLEENTETTLYRAIQEIVTNIIKHSKANKIGIQLIRHDKEISVLIDDNGIGFDTSKINEFEGIGLKNIISRIEFVNGTVNFDSTPGKGTTVVIDVPLA